MQYKTSLIKISIILLSITFLTSELHAQEIQRSTNEEGSAIFENLKPGEYSIKVEINDEIKEENIRIEDNGDNREIIFVLDQTLRDNLQERIVDVVLSPAFLVTSLAFVALPALISSAINYSSALRFLKLAHIPSFLAGLIKKKRHPWGVVYDSRTKQPLDPAIVTLTGTDGKVYQAMTDIYGRYEFFVNPGVYSLIVQKSDYSFPSKIINNNNDEKVYDNVLTGGRVEVFEGKVVNYNIPMDPVSANWNQQEKIKMGIKGPNKVLIPAASLVFQFGFLLSLISLLVNFTTFSLIVFITYLCILGFRIFNFYSKNWGIVKIKGGEELSGVIVNLENATYPELGGGKSVTDLMGRYNFLVEKGTYVVKVPESLGEGNNANVYTSDKIRIDEKVGRIGIDITLNKKPKQDIN